jgi:hypothetical protein
MKGTLVFSGRSQASIHANLAKNQIKSEGKKRVGQQKQVKGGKK